MRLIERWFPCAEVSEASMTGWGSGNSESSLWVWFAKRPTVQAKAAVLCSLLPWPEDEAEQQRLKALVRRSLTGYAKAQDEIRALLTELYPKDAAVLDPFSGRGMIPLEAGRLGARPYGLDYSPFATLGGWLLARAPFLDYAGEPKLPFDPWALPYEGLPRAETADDGGLFAAVEPSSLKSKPGDDRFIDDVRTFLAETGRRFSASMAEFYPRHKGTYPWGYLWAATLPCQECGRRFPLIGELRLRREKSTEHAILPAQSFRIETDPDSGRFYARVHEGDPEQQPTRVLAGKSKYASDGRVAVCSFCGYRHTKALHTRLAAEGQRQDELLVAADLEGKATKTYREPTDEEYEAVRRAARQLAAEPPFGLLPARPDERIPAGNTRTIQSVNYGDRTYGDLCEARQTLGLVRLARAIDELSQECLAAKMSAEYVKALAGYATATMMRKIRRSTRGARLEMPNQKVGDIFVNQSAVTFSYDWFESGLSASAGSWTSIAEQTLTTLRSIRSRVWARPATIERGNAAELPFPDAFYQAVVTDPPYDDMIDYSDSSDLFYVWLKRAMATADPGLSFTMNPHGVQEKEHEAIIKRGGAPAGDHRTRDHYGSLIERAYAEAARVVEPAGVVTLVFGHGDVEVWRRMLSALQRAGLVLVASWPAKTEAGGGGAGSANIVTTLTLACRVAPPGRGDGQLKAVEADIRAAVSERMREWERSGLATTDMLMASVGPAMEVVGRYKRVLDYTGEPVSVKTFLSTARRAVKDASAVRVDTLPLAAFDDRTQFALWWVWLFRRGLAAKSELRNELMAAEMAATDVRGIVHTESKGCRFARAQQARQQITEDSAVVDIVLTMARVWPEGIDSVARVLAAAGRSEPDEHVWAVLAFLSEQLRHPDTDAGAWDFLLRNRYPIESAARTVVISRPNDHKALRNSESTLF